VALLVLATLLSVAGAALRLKARAQETGSYPLDPPRVTSGRDPA
jgi:hypothetical protein